MYKQQIQKIYMRCEVFTVVKIQSWGLQGCDTMY